jgi:hypothetical protein
MPAKHPVLASVCSIWSITAGTLLANVAWGGAKRFEAIWADTRKPIDSFKDADWSRHFTSGEWTGTSARSSYRWMANN